MFNKTTQPELVKAAPKYPGVPDAADGSTAVARLNGVILSLAGDDAGGFATDGLGVVVACRCQDFLARLRQFGEKQLA